MPKKKPLFGVVTALDDENAHVELPDGTHRIVALAELSSNVKEGYVVSLEPEISLVYRVMFSKSPFAGGDGKVYTCEVNASRFIEMVDSKDYVIFGFRNKQIDD